MTVMAPEEHRSRYEAPGLRAGLVFRMVLQREYRHNEMIRHALPLERSDSFPAPDTPLRNGDSPTRRRIVSGFRYARDD